MGKSGGGTRNYSHQPKTMAKRKAEFDELVATGLYTESYFDKSGGYYISHKDHAIKEDAESKERFAAQVLAAHGYRLFLMPDQSYVEGLSKNDGFTEHAMMDIKTVKNVGVATIKNTLEKASKQKAEIVILVQNSPKVTKDYITKQIDLFHNTPSGKHNETLKAVWVISMDGKRIHRRKI